MTGTHLCRKVFSAAMPTGPAGQAAAVGEPRAPLTVVVPAVVGVVAVPVEGVVPVAGVVLELVVVVVGSVLVGSVPPAIARASPQALGARKENVAVFDADDSAAGSLLRSRSSVAQSPRSRSEWK